MTEKSINLTAGKMVYLDGGNGKNILFMHGGVATPYAYLPLFEKLSADYRILAPTHPGHGQSFCIQPQWTLNDFVDTYVNFLRQVNFQPQYLIGHSFGGALSLLLASSFPQADIIAFDSAGLPLLLNATQYVQFMVQEAKVLLKQKKDISSIESAIPKVGSIIQTIVYHPNDLPWLAANVLTMDITQQLSSVTNRAKLIWGEKDIIVSPQIGIQMQKLIKRSELLFVRDEGHTYPAIDTELTYNIIIQAIKCLVCNQNFGRRYF